MKKLINKYNSKDTLLVISLYPKKEELYSAGTSGVASYTKNVVNSMNRKVIVLANYYNNKRTYEEGNVLVLRCFKNNTKTMWAALLKNLIKFNQVKQVLIQFDFAIYGGILTSSIIVPFLFILKLLGYKVSLVMHHVVIDINKLSGHVGLNNNSIDRIKAAVYNFVFHLFYKLIYIVTDQIIVLEEKLKDKLSTLISHKKIAAIPHGVDTNFTLMPKEKARKILKINKDEEVILFFGFVNWFKGADFLADAFKSQTHMLGKKIRCIIAGGASPTLKNRSYYKTYFKSVLQKIHASKTVEITGYISQEKISAYFAACDLVIFPYRHFMTASGVLSLTFSYKKPFIISSELAQMFDAKDFIQALKIVELDKKDIVFDLNKKSCLKLTEKVLQNGLKRKLIQMSELIRQKRSYKNTALLYEATLFNPAKIYTNKSFAFDSFSIVRACRELSSALSRTLRFAQGKLLDSGAPSGTPSLEE